MGKAAHPRPHRLTPEACDQLQTRCSLGPDDVLELVAHGCSIPTTPDRDCTHLHRLIYVARDERFVVIVINPRLNEVVAVMSLDEQAAATEPVTYRQRSRAVSATDTSLHQAVFSRNKPPSPGVTLGISGKQPAADQATLLGHYRFRRLPGSPDALGDDGFVEKLARCLWKKGLGAGDFETISLTDDAGGCLVLAADDLQAAGITGRWPWPARSWVA